MGDSVGREGEEEEGEEGEEEEEEEEGPLVQSHHGSRPAAAPASSTSPLRGWRHSSGFAAKPRLAKQAALQDSVVGKAAEWLEGAGGLARRYGAPPFSVLDARKGYWKARRRFWEVEYRIHSEFGRPDNLLGYKGLGCDAARGTSVFCPVLCELCYRWFCPAGGAVLDPFAGGSARGCVAARTGLRYVGLDLSRSQVDENRKQAQHIEGIAKRAGAKWVPPRWLCADARELITGGATGGVAGGGSGGAGSSSGAGSSTGSGSSGGGLEGVVPVGRAYDFLFSCPPYYDLERYSDDPNDLSAAPSYEAFLEAYQSIIRASVSRLKPDRFCAFVVGEIRDADGFCRNFVGDTISAFQACGAKLYNSAIMMLPLHSLPMRAAASFNATAKLGMCHQHVLVFYTGKQPNKAVKALGLHNAQRSLEWF